MGIRWGSLLIFVNAIFLSHMISETTSQLEFAKSLCPNSANYTVNSTYRANLETLVSSLQPLLLNFSSGFYTLSAGQKPDKVNGAALCRGDLSAEVCKGCIDVSTNKIIEVCPNQRAAIVWYNQCMLRFSDSEIIGVMNNLDSEYIFNGRKAAEPNKFIAAVRSLMDRLRIEAASGNSTRKFASGHISVGNETVYGIVQCTPDLSSKDCDKCVAERAMLINEASLGARIFTPTCVLRYENYIFLIPPPNLSLPNSPPPSPSHPPPPTAGSNDKGKMKGKGSSTTIIIIVVSIISAIILVIGICFLLRVKSRKHKKSSEFENVGFQEESDEISSMDTVQFDFNAIKVATNDFSDENKLGEGGFGVVYQGSLSNGENVAVKRLSRNSGQGDVEFKNEVLVMAKLQHRNLVRLLGFCLEGNERLLIYEFLPNASLDNFIFDLVKRAILDWEKRYQIIIGIARGLLYLHEDSRIRIIHRDLKASNILLDINMNPKIADFGMARLFELDETRGQTNRIVGTYGYMAPEYAYHGHFSIKSDVFSFGVLILEIISGRKNNSFHEGENAEDLASFAWKSWREGRAENVIDRILSSSSSSSRSEMIRCIHIGLLCVQENAADRPTMATVILMLNSFSLTLCLPTRPAFFLQSDMSSDNENQASQNGASISDFQPR